MKQRSNGIFLSKEYLDRNITFVSMRTPNNGTGILENLWVPLSTPHFQGLLLAAINQ
jgi:hypothetical protein